MHRSHLLDRLPPAAISTQQHFVGSHFGNAEKETVARNIVVMAKRSERWAPFSVEDYAAACGSGAEPVLTQLAAQGYLAREGRLFSVTERFLHVVGAFATLQPTEAERQAKRVIETAGAALQRAGFDVQALPTLIGTRIEVRFHCRAAGEIGTVSQGERCEIVAWGASAYAELFERAVRIVRRTAGRVRVENSRHCPF